jgi:hypothetical protein
MSLASERVDKDLEVPSSLDIYQLRECEKVVSGVLRTVWD